MVILLSLVFIALQLLSILEMVKQSRRTKAKLDDLYWRLLGESDAVFQDVDEGTSQFQQEEGR